MGSLVGRGLGALLHSDNDRTQVDRLKEKMVVIKKLEAELQEVRTTITERKRALEELRKDLTIKLMLNGSIDRSPLVEAERSLNELNDLKDRIQKELDTIKFENPGIVKETGDMAIGPVQNKVVLSTDIDMRLISELIPKGPIPEPERTYDGPPGDSEYIEGLKDELSPRKDAIILRMEASKTPSMTTDDGTSPRPSPIGAMVQQGTRRNDPRQSVGQIPSSSKGPSMVPRKVRVKVGGPPPPAPSKDKRMYEIIDSSVAMMERGDPAGAKEALLNALQDYAMDDELLYHLGNAFFMLGDLDNAEIRFKKASERNPSSYRALNNLGVVLRKKGNKEQAIRTLNRALEVNPKYERAWFNLGTLFMEIEPPLLKEAHIFLRRALECDPNYHKAKEKLSELMKLMQKGS